MVSTIESFHKKITIRFGLLVESTKKLSSISNHLTLLCSGGCQQPDSHKNTTTNGKFLSQIDSLCLNLKSETIKQINSDYNLVVLPVMMQYYKDKTRETQITKEYYNLVTADNYCGQLSSISRQLSMACSVLKDIAKYLAHDEVIAHINTIIQTLDDMPSLTIAVQRKNLETCKCGERIIFIPDQSIMHCPNGCISKNLTIDEFDAVSARCKRNGYDSARHCRFWLDRLQAKESRNIDPEILDRIKTEIKDRGFVLPHELTCKEIRKILKTLRLTSLNDSAPLLIKLCGGTPPPQLDFTEEQAVVRFVNRAMEICGELNAESGNKPYYPGYIYKALLHVLHDKPQKLRLTEYIHFQSRWTIHKNEDMFERICKTAKPEDDLELIMTDPIRW